ncbi:MAG: metallophosphoesterase family protein [Clostridia bacterium]|nr:metallophosphoesterase family protein [Clostridia bacterium]
MKIIHCSDLHLDSKMETNLTANKAQERKKEILLTFENMAEYAFNNNVCVIIIAGDMFDCVRVSAITKNRILNIIKKYNNIDFLYLFGNHDEDSLISQIGDIPNNLKLFSEEWYYHNYENVTIAGAKLNSTNNALLYHTLAFNENNINIAILHGQISKYDNKDFADLINITKLKNKYINYLALGHIHTYSKGRIDDRGIYCYSGCLEGRGSDECGKKGFVLLNIENDSIKDQFVPFAKRIMHEFYYDITGKNNWYDIEKSISELIKSVSKDDLIRIVLTGKYKLELEKNIDLFCTKLNNKYYFSKIKDESTLEIDPKVYENDISLKGEFIRKVMSSDYSKQEKDSIILCGINALKGEE